MKHLLTLGGLAASMFMISCDRNDSDENINAQDRNFVNQITLSNRTEIALSNMAMTMATDPSVRNYAQMMVTEHTAAENDLRATTDNLGIALASDSLNMMGTQMRTMLMGMSGRQFDSAYIVGQIALHDSTRMILQMQANSGASGPLRTYANNLLPRVDMHRMMADTMATRFR